MKTNVIFISLLVLFISHNACSNTVKWENWSEQILLDAKKSGRLVLLDMTAEWCPYCKKMKRVSYKDKKVIDELNQNYICVRVDEEKYPQLAKKYAHVGRPGTIILDAKGNEIVSKTGYLKPQWLLWMLQGTAAENIMADKIIVSENSNE